MDTGSRRSLLSIAVIVGLLLGSACSATPTGSAGNGDTPSGSASPTSVAPTAGPPCPGPGPGPAPGPGASPGGCDWTSGPVAVTHDITVPPVPTIFGIRSAPHQDQGFDRVVFDFHGELPGYTVRYVDEVREDGSGRLVTVPGRRYLQIVFHPAQAHTEDGAALVSPARRALDYPMMRGYVLVGDFEGYVSVAVGLDDVVGYRVGELPGDPGRIYLDVAA